MSTTRFIEQAHAAKASTSDPAKGFFGRIYAVLLASRQRQADREIEHYLARQSDRMLRDIGMSQEDIASLRERHGR